jgi:alkyldihydroxyacetonephosphate synthase
MSVGVREDPLTIEARVRRVAAWGRPPASAASLAGRIGAEVGRRIGPLPDTPMPAAGAAHVPTVPESRLDGGLEARLARTAPTTTAGDARAAFSLGKSYPDLLAARGRELERACDAVVSPRTEGELERVLAQLTDAEVSVVPVGGGTSVVGGIEPIGRRADEPVAALDLSRLCACLDVDVVSRLATFQAGVRGPALERSLAAFGLTLGHTPQSFELSTLGGWIATRSAGQLSLGFGKLDRMTAGLRMLSPAGALAVDPVPAHSAGPDALGLALGSEGTLGVISRATLRVVARPERVRLSSFCFASFSEAADAGRTLVQAGIPAAGVRVSDGAETGFLAASSAPGVLRGALGRGVVRLLGMGRASIVFVIVTGSDVEVSRIDSRVDAHMRRAGGRALGPVPARSWYRTRFVQPFARDALMDRGLVVDTLETAAPWSRLTYLHDQLTQALTSALGPGRCVVGSHLSHLYRDGASLYVTFMSRPDAGRELATWRAAKRAAHEVILRCRAAASHQHAVGTMHADLARRLQPSLAEASWQVQRTAFDAGGQMNPGKLLELAPAGIAALNAVSDVSGGPGRAPSPGARPGR